MKGILNSPVVYLWRKMYEYAGNRKKNINLATFMFVMATIVVAIQPVVFALFLNFVQKNDLTKQNLPHLFLILLLLVATELVFWVFWGPARVIEQKSAFAVRKNYKEYLLKGVMALSLPWHADHHSGDTIDKIEKGSLSIFYFSMESHNFISAFLKLLISFSVLAYFSLYPSLIVIVISIFTFYIMFTYDKKLVPGYRVVNRLENKTAAKVYDVISNITTVIILRIENLVFKSISKSIDKPLGQFNENVLNNEKKWFWASIFGQISVALMVGLYLFLGVKAGTEILIGSIYILYSYASRVKDTFFSFALLYSNSEKWKASIHNAEEISKDFIQAELSENKHLPRNWSSLSVRNLSFSYHESDDADLHLDEVNISFKKGEKIAVIGESGGGKTTFLKLFRGLYLPKTIVLEIDDKVQNNDFNSISDSISLIPQDPEIFATTIRENITLGVEYSDEEISKYTDLSAFTDVATRLPKGLESNIVEKGVNLSGGEKQRLALARGLLASKDKDIVLLDEPTSSVDFHNELKIYENIFKAMPEKTIISSIHRLHLLSLFDNIYFFKDGKVVANGNLDQLKSESPDFQKLWEKYLKTQNQ
ncbi:MAG: ABC transporter ATP-binding protein [Candidatus Pacebacteria bacterium]|nr:ABC transporter ATP-binding protein [Candidatus Paceibacterota bacterium]MBP9851523.1 ABC transporter ATP-binding protein [Candidatus Paceibacterota bacterium]